MILLLKLHVLLGALWAATNDGANRIDPARDAFSVYRHRPGREPTLGPGTVLTIDEGSEGSLWVGHLGGGLDSKSVPWLNSSSSLAVEMCSTCRRVLCLRASSTASRSRS